jgi:hypothetical protein
MSRFIKNYLIFIIILTLLASCQALKPKKVDLKDRPLDARERAKQNIAEGRGISLSKLGNRSTNYEFSTSNPLWRASLGVVDFMPLATVDYSGGIIITDWYNSDPNTDNQSIKITIRFLSNEVKSDSLKIIIHKKNCNPNTSCLIKEIKSEISKELYKSILARAAALEKETKKK